VTVMPGSQEASRPLRVLQVTTMPVGAEWFFDQVTGLAELGHTVCAVFPETGPLVGRLRSAGVRVEIIPFHGKHPRHLARIAAAEWRLMRLMRSFRPDVIHAHLLKAAVSSRLASLGYRPALRVNQLPGVLHLHSPLLRWADRLTLFRDDIVVGSCEAIADQYRAMGARSVAVSYYGCDVHRFDPLLPPAAFRREFGLADSTPTVGIVGRLCPTGMRGFQEVGFKGHEVFLDAVPLILSEMPGAHFFVVGDDHARTGAYRRDLAARAAALGVRSHVHFTGWRSDIPNVLAGLDVVVSASLEESACYAAVEALLMRCGVVATNVGGLPDTVRNGHSGILVPPGDRGQLAAAVVQLLADPALRRRLGSRGREHCLRRFDIAATVASVDALYQSGLKQLPRRRSARLPSRGRAPVPAR
jgi:glycosyltransferase involved in cell wall biosynthesis